MRTDPALRQRLDALERSDEEIAPGVSGRLARASASARGSPARGRRTRSRWRVPLALVRRRGRRRPRRSRAWIAPPPGRRRARDRRRSHQGAAAVARHLSAHRTAAKHSPTAASRAAGDLLRVGYTGAGRAYGVILSIDGRGVVTRHLPPIGDRAAPLEARRRGAPRPGVRAGRCAGVGAVLFRDGRHAVRGRADVDAARKAAAGDAPRAAGRAAPSPRGSRNPRFRSRKRSDRDAFRCCPALALLGGLPARRPPRRCSGSR